MIYLKLHGRLGNQLFQYAFALNLRETYFPNEKIVICVEELIKNGCQYQLGEIGIKADYIQEKFPLPIVGMLFRVSVEPFKRYIIRNMTGELKRKKLRKIWQAGNKFGIYCGVETYFYLDSIACDTRNKYCSGLFESEKYFSSVKEQIKKIIGERYCPIVNTQLYKSIVNCESVCVTVRRGDFLSNQFSEVHNVCTIEYYKKAVEFIVKKVPDCKIFVFSDDIEWCKKNLDFGIETQYESGKDTLLEKIRLMSSCRHFVISNSTFSWWAQHLSENNENEIVVAPYPWKRINDHTDIYCNGFYIMNVETYKMSQYFNGKLIYDWK